MWVTTMPIVIGVLETVLQGLGEGTGGTKISGRIETIQIVALLRLARILRRVQETRVDLLSPRPQWKTPVKDYQLRIVWKTRKKWNDKKKKIRTPREKETYKYLGLLEADTIKQAEMNEKKKKEYLSEQESSRNQTTLQKSHQSDKYEGCSSRKILGTILKMDVRRSSTNRNENKKTHDDP